MLDNLTDVKIIRHPEKINKPDNFSPPKPSWLKVKAPIGKIFDETKGLLDDLKIVTVCEEASCPNIGNCWSKKHATMMIMGATCTRACSFCNVATGKPEDVDPFEAARVAKSIKLMGLKHAVITSVDRDDLKDGGAAAWKKTVELTRRHNPGITIETLIPDFKGEWENLQPIIDVAPEVVSHNMETVRRITAKVRVQAKYDRSLEVLKRLKDGGIERTKSGIMVGLGEFEEEVLATMDDLRSVGVSIMTIGQYMQPSKKHLAISEFVHPDVFAFYKEEGMKRGFKHVESGPLVRSSYHAEKHL